MTSEADLLRRIEQLEKEVKTLRACKTCDGTGSYVDDSYEIGGGSLSSTFGTKVKCNGCGGSGVRL